MSKVLALALTAAAVSVTQSQTFKTSIGSYSAHALVGRERLVLVGTTHTVCVDLKTGKPLWRQENSTPGMSQPYMRAAATKSLAFTSGFQRGETTIDMRDMATGKLLATAKLKGYLDEKVISLDANTFGFVPLGFGEPTMHAIGSKNWTPMPAMNRVPFGTRKVLSFGQTLFAKGEAGAFRVDFSKTILGAPNVVFAVRESLVLAAHESPRDLFSVDESVNKTPKELRDGRRVFGAYRLGEDAVPERMWSFQIGRGLPREPLGAIDDVRFVGDQVYGVSSSGSGYRFDAAGKITMSLGEVDDIVVVKGRALGLAIPEEKPTLRVKDFAQGSTLSFAVPSEQSWVYGIEGFGALIVSPIDGVMERFDLVPLELKVK